MENIDTDQIIPARFLKATSRDGFGKNLFRDWRYENDDEIKPKTDFVFNNLNIREKFWLQEKISVAALHANMLPGLSWIMDLM